MEFLNSLCEMPSVTSININLDGQTELEEIYNCLSQNKRLLSVTSPSSDLGYRLQGTIDDNQQYLEETDRTFMIVKEDRTLESCSHWRLSNDTRIFVSFVGPLDGDLNLRIICLTDHSSDSFDAFTVQINLNGTCQKIYQIEHQPSENMSKVIEYNVNLHCGDLESSAGELYYLSGQRNELALTMKIEPERIYTLKCMELLRDKKAWNPMSEWEPPQHEILSERQSSQASQPQSIDRAPDITELLRHVDKTNRIVHHILEIVQQKLDILNQKSDQIEIQSVTPQNRQENNPALVLDSLKVRLNEKQMKKEIHDSMLILILNEQRLSNPDKYKELLSRHLLL
ncbi:hypothetical protein BDQ17DRAFT_525716 [Cyathus striatus]|nr:hypothetical protein BDQ17DRAFT_525716 [Cyathus striatus]